MKTPPFSFTKSSNVSFRSGMVALGISLTLLLPCRAENNTDYIFNGTSTNYAAYSYFLLNKSGAGTNNSLQILNGGSVSNDYGAIGNGSGEDYDYAIISGTNSSGAASSWVNRDRLSMGGIGSYNRLIVTNGGYVESPRLFVADSAGGTNTIIVTGSNSLLNLTNGLNDFFVGYAGNGGNQLLISDGGRMNNNVTYVGYGAGNNTLIVSGSGSVWSTTGTLSFGHNAGGNLMIITNGGRVDAAALFIGGIGTPDNRFVVVGSNSLFSAPSGDFSIVGNNANLTLADGGRVSTAIGYIGNSSSPHTNITVLVTGAGSQWTNSGELNVGYLSSGVQLIISNGGRVDNLSGYVGRTASSTNNTVIVTGPGSLWRNGAQVYVGNTAGLTVGGGAVLVANGGTLESTGLNSGLNGSGTISNQGGIYQFTQSAPTITVNTANSIVLTNGTISFRGVTDADVFNDTGSGAISAITYQGNNTFRLNSSSNTAAVAQSYTFDTGRGATNYAGLELVNGTTLWRSSTLTIGSGGHMLASNTVGTVQAAFISTGSVEVSHSTMTYASNVTIVGSYRSDPSTNIFQQNVTLASSGTMAGGVGDRFEFQKNWLISNSVNTSGAFDLASSTVAFTGGGVHTNAITGKDLGSTNGVGLADGFTAANFSYGRLTLDSTNDQVQFVSGDGSAVSNALYVSWLDLAGFTNAFGGNVSNMVTSLLFAPSSIHIYYEISGLQPNDAYLQDKTYTLSGGGLLLPAIPEPSELMWFAVALGCILRRKR